MIRTATLSDIAQLLALECASFRGDHISRRSFIHMLGASSALTIVDEKQDCLRGYITLLFRKNTSVARIYSVATHPDFLGKGVGAGLLAAAESAALARGKLTMRLEIRKDNQASLRLFTHLGYRIFGQHEKYYEDDMDAHRLEKPITQRVRPELTRARYYGQTLGFTCGPASLMMAMKSFRPDLKLDRTLELQLWREATTIFMTAGHGGCGPHGLALSANSRGFPCEIYVSGSGILFQNSTRGKEKREVIRIVQKDFENKVAERSIPLHRKAASMVDLSRSFRDGGIPIVLISTYRLTRERAPHWVTITGCDEHHFYIHDPDHSGQRDADDCIGMAIPKKEFERMARYGRKSARATIVIYPPAMLARI